MGVKHKGKPAVHGFKAHVGADTDTATVKELAVTSANIINDRSGRAALPDNPGEVFAVSASRGSHFRDAVRAAPRVVSRALSQRYVGSRRTRDAPNARRLEPADRPGPRPDREDLRNMETKLRPAPDAMARDCKDRLPKPPHRHRLRSQTSTQYRATWPMRLKPIQQPMPGKRMSPWPGLCCRYGSIKIAQNSRPDIPKHRPHQSADAENAGGCSPSPGGTPRGRAGHSPNSTGCFISQ